VEWSTAIKQAIRTFQKKKLVLIDQEKKKVERQQARLAQVLAAKQDLISQGLANPMVLETRRTLPVLKRNSKVKGRSEADYELDVISDDELSLADDYNPRVSARLSSYSMSPPKGVSPVASCSSSTSFTVRDEASSLGGDEEQVLDDSGATTTTTSTTDEPTGATTHCMSSSTGHPAHTRKTLSVLGSNSSTKLCNTLGISDSKLAAAMVHAKTAAIDEQRQLSDAAMIADCKSPKAMQMLGASPASSPRVPSDSELTDEDRLRLLQHAPKAAHVLGIEVKRCDADALLLTEGAAPMAILPLGAVRSQDRSVPLARSVSVDDDRSRREKARLDEILRLKHTILHDLVCIQHSATTTNSHASATRLHSIPTDDAAIGCTQRKKQEDDVARQKRDHDRLEQLFAEKQKIFAVRSEILNRNESSPALISQRIQQRPSLVDLPSRSNSSMALPRLIRSPDTPLESRATIAISPPTSPHDRSSASSTPQMSPHSRPCTTTTTTTATTTTTTSSTPPRSPHEKHASTSSSNSTPRKSFSTPPLSPKTNATTTATTATATVAAATVATTATTATTTATTVATTTVATTATTVSPTAVAKDESVPGISLSRGPSRDLSSPLTSPLTSPTTRTKGFVAKQPKVKLVPKE
jgi:hypothetical protein